MDESAKLAAELDGCARRLSRMDVADVKARMGAVETSMMRKCFHESDDQALKLVLAASAGTGLGVLLALAIPSRWKCHVKCE